MPLAHYISRMPTTPTETPVDTTDTATETENVKAARHRTDKALSEYEEVSAVVMEAGDEELTPELLHKWDVSYTRALGSATNLTRLLNPDVFTGSLSAPRRRTTEPRPVRPGAASKDGEMMCTGLPGVDDSPGCGKVLPVDKFPTTGTKDETGTMTRASECRGCRKVRRERRKAAKAAS